MKINTIAEAKKYLPKRSHPTDAGADLIAAENKVIYPGESYLISTGVKMQIPIGYAGLIHSRSGLAANHGVVVMNGVGVIDSDYRGTVKVNLKNDGNFPFEVEDGMRIAQLLVEQVERPEFVAAASLTDTERGEGGHGSTGR